MSFGDLPGSIAFSGSPGVFDEEFCPFLAGSGTRVHILIHRNDNIKLGVLQICFAWITSEFGQKLKVIWNAMAGLLKV